jgi:hypothetical protein
MSIKKGIDRLSIVVAILAMIAFTAMIVVVGMTKGFASFKEMLLVIAGAAVVSVLVSLFGIRGIAYVIVWIMEGFREEEKR